MAWELRLRWRPSSQSSALRWHLPRMSAALRPAGPPPTMRTSNCIKSPFVAKAYRSPRLCLEPLTAVRTLAVGKRIMPRAKTAAQWTELTLEERRERRRLRREKQREDNVKRAAKMHTARLKSETKIAKPAPEH